MNEESPAPPLSTESDQRAYWKKEFEKGKKELQQISKNVEYLVQNGITNEEVIDMYDSWAETYDEDLDKIGYYTPQKGAEELSALLGNNKSARILDCGAGTGLCGVELAKLGLSNVDALDASQPMLDQAKKKGVYKNYICDYMGPNTLDIPDDTYDALLIVGAFTGGHVKCDCFEELIRITKPGGFIVLVMLKESVQRVDEYRDRLLPQMDRLAEQRKWKWVLKKEHAEAVHSDTGIAFGFQKLRWDKEPEEHEQDIQDILKFAYHITRKDVTKEEVADAYTSWATTYDEDVSKIGYNSPIVGARELSTLLGGNKSARILDCGAGTGLCGVELAKLGFSNVDALDASQPMLDQAKKKGVYKNYICDYMGPNTLDIPDDTYVGLVSVGTFSGGHAKCDCFDELIRITKPGGVILVGIMENILHDTEEFRDRLVPTIEQLVGEKKWTWLQKKRVENYVIGKPGLTFGFKVL